MTCIGQGFPVHPITGLTAIGFKKSGDPIWPIMGGDGTEPTPGEAVPLVEGGNPAWNDFLRYVPEDERQQVVPVLQQWDKGVQDRFQQVHSEYEPWKDIVKSGMDPETVQFATELLATLQEDPRKIYDSLGEHFHWNGEEPPEEGADSGQGLEEGALEFDLENHPAFQQIANQNKLLTDLALAQRNMQLEAEQEAQLESELEAAKTAIGEYDEELVLLRLASTDDSVEDAVKWAVSKSGNNGPRRPAPRLHNGSGGGAAPTPRMDVKKLTPQEARSAFADMLRAANREG